MLRTMVIVSAVFLAAASALVVADTACGADQDSTYRLKKSENGMLLLSPQGKVVLQYLTRKPPDSNLAASSTSCFHPVNTPSGIRVTDLAPGDHHHHRGIFLAWHTLHFQWPADFSALPTPYPPTAGVHMARADFWGWGEFGPTDGRVIRNRDVKLTKADGQQAELMMIDDWMIHDQLMMTQVTRAMVREVTGAYVLDLDYQLTPKKELVLNHSSFGGFCVRARNDGISEFADADGTVTLPDAWYSDPGLNWPARPWYDYTVRLENDQPDNGQTVGCTVIEHPGNRSATWHNPRYIWMINPCIVAAGPVTVKADDTLRLRYRLLIHDGPTPTALIEKLSADYRQ